MTLLAGQKLRASDLNTASVSNADATSRTTTSASYTTTLSPANICGVSFTAPPSGKVLLLWVTYMVNSGVGYCLCSPEIRTGSTVGSGTVFLAAHDDRTVQSTGTSADRVGASYLATGLTAATVYNVALTHLVQSGTGTFLRREVTVIPQLA